MGKLLLIVVVIASLYIYFNPNVVNPILNNWKAKTTNLFMQEKTVKIFNNADKEGVKEYNNLTHK